MGKESLFKIQCVLKQIIMHSKMKCHYQIYQIVNARLNFLVFMKAIKLKYLANYIIL